MTNPLFSTYRAGENRITSSTLAVFERIDLTIVKEVLQGASGMGDEGGGPRGVSISGGRRMSASPIGPSARA